MSTSKTLSICILFLHLHKIQHILIYMKNLSLIYGMFFFMLVDIFSCLAINEESEISLFRSTEKILRKEYRVCTGDSSAIINIKYMIDWKRKMDAWKKSPEYYEALREYKKTSGAVDPVNPCFLLEWTIGRKAVQDSIEHLQIRLMLEKSEADDIASKLKAYMSSGFDFEEIPFGVSKDVFSYLFKKKFGTVLKNKGEFLFAENLPWNNGTFFTAFFFDTSDHFYRYEIESEAVSADSINRYVRPMANIIAQALQKKIGVPDHSYRIGLFDIKSNELAVVDKWETSDCSAYVGMSVVNYRYFAKAIVMNSIYKYPANNPGRDK